MTNMGLCADMEVPYRRRTRTTMTTMTTTMTSDGCLVVGRKGARCRCWYRCGSPVIILFSCCLSPTGDHGICSGSIMSCHIMCRLAGLCSQVLLFLISFPLFCLLNVSLSTKPCCMGVCVSTKNATRAFFEFYRLCFDCNFFPRSQL